MQNIGKASAIACALATSLTYTTPALAEDTSYSPNIYIGISYTQINTKVSVDGFGSKDIENGLLGGILGYRFYEYAAVEFRGYGNLNDSKELGVSAKISRDFSILLKPVYSIDQYFEVYGLVGYGQVEGKIGDLSETSDGLQYGVGIGVMGGKSSNFGVGFEWTRRFDDDFETPGVNFRGDGFNLNVTYHFK
ncbi:porin family protein [Vibrio gallicus]|uniref:porin family protein n=1 Tax=Vibrio gallicus TaxID=190897 RepID=UPI0021C39C4F|nr:porin family protein [Vibrio gallicus]